MHRSIWVPLPRHPVTKMNPSAVYLCSLGERLDSNAEPERFQARDEAALEPGGVPLVEVVMAQLTIRGPVLQDVVRNHENTVGHSHHRLLLPAAPGEPMVLRPEIGPGVTGGPRGRDESRPQPLVPLPGLPRLPLPSTLVVAGGARGCPSSWWSEDPSLDPLGQIQSL